MLSTLRIDQLGHVNLWPTVGEQHREKDEAVRGAYEDYAQVHPAKD